MEIDVIKQIIELMKSNDLNEFEMEEDKFRLAIKRNLGRDAQVMVSPMAAPMMMAPQAMAPAPVAQAAEAAAKPAPEAPKENLVEIKAPIVGTFYRAAAPDAESFVNVGSTINKESVVCIIEAMKVMNEIKAEVSGVIRKIMVENATPVQFGQVLFLVEPS